MGYFLPYQARWIKDNSPIKLYRKTRRGGITYATSYRCVDKCLREKKGSSFKQWVSSRDELTAKEFITDYVAMWAKKANEISREMAEAFEGVIGLDGENFEVVDEKRDITARVVRFKNGARIISLSSNPLAFAGKGGDVLIDEWDLHEDQGAMWDMAFPCVVWGGQLEVVSAFSPTGTEDTEFAKLCVECDSGNRPDISFHSTTILQAVDDGFVEKVNEVKAKRGIKPQTREEFLTAQRNGCRNQDAWNTQFMCIPNRASGNRLVSKEDLAASKSAFEIIRIELEGLNRKGDKVEPCCKPYIDTEYWRSILREIKHPELGWDIAVTGDLASISVNDRLGDGRKQLKINITFKTCKISSQRKIVEAMYEANRRIIGCGDKSGVGYSDCVTLEDKYPDRFQGVVFSGNAKLIVMTTLQGAFECQQQMLPLSNPEISEDIAAMKTGKTPNNHLTFIHGENKHLLDSHCDICISIALAIYAGEILSAGIADAIAVTDNSRYGSDGNNDFDNPEMPFQVPSEDRFGT